MEPMLASAGVILSRRCVQQKQSSDDRQPCLGNPCPKGPESTLTENVASPFHAEPTQLCIRAAEPRGDFPEAESGRNPWLTFALQCVLTANSPCLGRTWESLLRW